MDICVSVIVPIYNVETYLKECIDSIINQTYRKFELILVDDGSTDNCGEICDEYAKQYKYIKVIHKRNEGLSSARNIGIENALGDYYCFIDSDDFIHPEYLSTLTELAVKYNADLVCCRYVKGYECRWNDNEPEKLTFYNEGEIIDNIYIDDSVKTVAWNKLYKKDFFVKYGLRYPKYKIHEDMFLSPQILYYAKCMVITSKSLYFYRVRKDSIIMSDFSLRKLDLLEAVEFRLKFFKQIHKNKLYYLELESYIRKLIHFYSIMSKEDKVLYKEQLNIIRRKYKLLRKKYLWDPNLNFRSKVRLVMFIILIYRE